MNINRAIMLVRLSLIAFALYLIFTDSPLELFISALILTIAIETVNRWIFRIEDLKRENARLRGVIDRMYDGGE